MPYCCQCNGSGSRWKSCACVKSGRPCDNCAPGRSNVCHNRPLPCVVPNKPPTFFPSSFATVASPSSTERQGTPTARLRSTRSNIDATAAQASSCKASKLSRFAAALTQQAVQTETNQASLARSPQFQPSRRLSDSDLFREDEFEGQGESLMLFDDRHVLSHMRTNNSNPQRTMHTTVTTQSGHVHIDVASDPALLTAIAPGTAERADPNVSAEAESASPVV